MTHLPPHPRPTAIVIGSGFGGLAAAIRLGARGYKTTILERLDAPGGRAYVYREAGFTFDGGPTIITAPFLLEELWTLCHRRLSEDIDLRPITPFYRIRFTDGATFNYTGDAYEMRAEIATFSPTDVPGYDAFIQATKKIYEVGFEQLGDVPFDSWTDMARLTPQLLKLGSLLSVHQLVSRYVKNDRLRTVLSFHPLLVGGNPFAASSIYSLICFLERRWGVHFAMGGTGALVTGMANLIAGQGGTIRCNTQVAEITTANNTATGVTLTDGTHLPASVVVSNACAAHTYGTLLARHPRRRWTNARIARGRYSMSLFVWYFGTTRRYEDVAHHTILLGPRYRALLRDIFNRHVLADDFSLYLHRPTATDPSLAPAGCDAFYVLAPVPHLASGTNWQAAAEPYRRKIAQALSDTLLPNLEQNLAASLMLTPQDFQDRLLSHQGAAFGLEPILTQSAWFRPHNRSEEVENLFLVGAGTHPGAGLPGVLSSARILDKVVPHANAFA